MAKWGEGDPRWIVEERPDATNVNNWHWTERDASGWSKERIKELFTDCNIPNEIANLKITSVSKSEGEASANNRKGKLIFFYEWNLELKWEGSLINTEDEEISQGSIVIPNFSEENQIHEVDIQVSTDENTEQAEILKEIMRNVGRELICAKLIDYVSTLKIEFSKGMILPKKDGDVEPIKIMNLATDFNKVAAQPICLTNSTDNKYIDTTMISVKETFQCRGQEFYDVLTRIEFVRAFTRGDVKLDVREGGKFELFGGNIVGSFDKLIPGKKIIQKWRYKQWPTGHFSTVEININEKVDHTEVNMIQKGVPSSEAAVTKHNWERYYWNAIKHTFGFGTTIS